MNHNLTLIIALIIFVAIILRVYCIFVMGSTEKEPEELTLDDSIERAKQLFDSGMHLECQRFLTNELTKKYQSIELRKLIIRSYIATGNTTMASLHLEAILKIDPNDTEARDELAKIYLDNGQKRKALAIYEDIYESDKTNIVAIKNLARLYKDLGVNKKAIEMYNLLLEAEDEPETIANMKHTIAHLYLIEGENEDAMRVYEEISQLTPDDMSVLSILAELAYKMNNWDKCLEYYGKIMEVQGENIELLEKTAQIHFNRNEWDEALKVYHKLIELEGSKSVNYLHYQNRYCEILINKGQIQEAIEILTNLIADFPDEDSLAYTLAQAYISNSEYEKAISLYENLIESLPTEQTEILRNYISGVIANWALDMFNKGEYNNAFDKFYESLKYNPDNAEIYFKLGKCNCEIKSFQDAIGHFKRAISIAPQNSKYYFGLGWAFDELGDSKNAKAAFFDAISINPLDIRARKAYAISLTKELEYESAIEQFKEILLSEPNDADTAYNLALAYEIQGEIDLAKENYKKAIQMTGTHSEAEHNLALLEGNGNQ